MLTNVCLNLKDHLIPNIVTPHLIEMTEKCNLSDSYANVPKIQNCPIPQIVWSKTIWSNEVSNFLELNGFQDSNMFSILTQKKTEGDMMREDKYDKITKDENLIW